MTKIFEKTELVDLVPNEIAENLNNSQKLIIGQLISMNGLEQNKNNGFVFLSNQDFCNLIGISEPTLIKNIIKLEAMGLITRKAGKRSSKGSKASEYKLNLNTQNFTKDFTKDFSENLSINLSNDLSKEIVGIITEYQHFMNKAMDLLLKVNTKDFSDNLSNNFSTDTDIELDKDKEIDNNIINKNNNLNKIEEKENIFTNIEEKEETVQGLEVEETEEIDENLPIEETSDEETETKTFNIPTDMNENTVEKEIIEHFNKEKAVKQSTVDYKIIPLEEQERIFNTLCERLKASSSMEELKFKYAKLLKYFNTHTFSIWFREDAAKLFKDLCKNFETSTENENKAPSNLSNALDGIVISPTDLKPIESKKTVEETPTPNEPISEPTSPSNDEDGVTDQEEEEKPTESKATTIKVFKTPQQIRDDRMQELKQMIFFSETVEDLKEVSKKIAMLRNSICTDDMAELAEIMDEKCKEVA